ncbi:phenol hydroxylase subunit [Massilia niastensis]|uniref:phenol hydroxylase subunit n=1 Tax=Massilia niastensis TaxID=544911 RepID=UPI000362BE61|nr:phenol hydroxylase subunit [Massilia niastensis]
MHPDTTACPGMDVSKRWVRVTGAHDGFVEFDFAIADPALTVELILPRPAFDEFCRMNAVVQLEPASTD